MSSIIQPPNQTIEIVGHQTFETEFAHLWNSRHVPHAFLIAGERGIGKATLAYKITRFVLNQRNDIPSSTGLFDNKIDALDILNLDSDPESPESIKVTNNSHPNLLIIERSTSDQTKKTRQNIVLEDVKGLDNFLHMTANEDGWRVIIIDAVDDMNINAANYILKLLEEPPQKVLFLIIAHNLGRVLPTITSRCRKVLLNPPRIEEIKIILSQFDFNKDEEFMDKACYLSEGSVSRALQILNGIGSDTITEISHLLGDNALIDRNLLEKTTDKWLRIGRKQDKDPVYSILDFFIFWISKCLRDIAKEKSQSNRNNMSDIDCIKSLIDRLGMEELCNRLIKAQDILDNGINLNLDRKQIIYSVILTVAD
jgi:DNA polymerase-3 subunit delta'